MMLHGVPWFEKKNPSYVKVSKCYAADAWNLKPDAFEFK